MVGRAWSTHITDLKGGEQVMHRLMRIVLIAGVIIVVNMIIATRNPLASDPPCGEICESGSGCFGSCPICFPNPILFPGTCIAR